MTDWDQNLESYALSGQHGLDELHTLLRKSLHTSWALGGFDSCPKNTQGDAHFLRENRDAPSLSSGSSFLFR